MTQLVLFNSPRVGGIPVESIRRAVATAEVTPNELARRLGHTRGNGKPDCSPIRRAMGLHPEYKNGRKYFQQTVSYEKAARIIVALGLDPVDYGV